MYSIYKQYTATGVRIILKCFGLPMVKTEGKQNFIIFFYTVGNSHNFHENSLREKFVYKIYII